ncbi:MFS transporter, partial [Halobacterium sp. CBA1126]|uniref:MFS transporter n=1 Tax=Halobacterium sp. CBA1126 TaxID=2668074 RepID=UPI0018D23212
LLAGAAGGNIAAAQAYIADVTPPERRAGALGLVGAAFGLGFVFGPAVGGLLADETVVTAVRSALPAFVPVTRFSLPSFAAAGFSFVALVAAVVVLEEPPRTRSSAGRTSFVAQFRAALADATLRPLVVAFFLTSLSFAGVTVMFVPFVADVFGYGATEAALFLAYIGALGVLNQGVLVGALARRYGARWVVRAGVVSLCAALLVLAASPLAGTDPLLAAGPAWVTGGLAALLAFGALASFGNGAITVGLAALVSESAGAETQGSAFGVTQAPAVWDARSARRWPPPRTSSSRGRRSSRARCCWSRLSASCGRGRELQRREDGVRHAEQQDRHREQDEPVARDRRQRGHPRGVLEVGERRGHTR